MVSSGVFEIAAAVPDPELPALTIGELGVLRRAETEGEKAVVTLTPTYSGCPALSAIRSDVAASLRRAGWPEVEIHTVYAPPWTSDWITPEGRAKLEHGRIAPPGPASELAASRRRLPLLRPPAPSCPLCGAAEVEELSRFGAAACLSLWRCLSCAEPFEHFKAH